MFLYSTVSSPLDGSVNTIVIQVYTTTSSAEDEEVEDFYEMAK